MRKYQFKTTATMKPYNSKHWYIDAGIIPRVTIEAENVRAALNVWREIVQEKHYVSISASALKNKSPMYIDTDSGPEQNGWVITGKTDFDNDRRGWVSQYIELWVSVYEISNPFKEAGKNA